MAEKITLIEDIEQRAIDKFRSLGWATEDTLGRILTNSGITAKILAEMSKRPEAVDRAMIGRLISGINGVQRESRRSADAAQDGITQTDRRAREGDKRQQEALKYLGQSVGGTVKDVLNARQTSVDRVITELGTAVSRYSAAIRESNASLGRWTGFLGLAVTAVGSMVRIIDSVNNTMRATFAAGVAVEGGFNNLAYAAERSGITTDELSKNLRDFSGTAVTLGSRRLLAMSAQIAGQTRLGADLMMTQEELNRAFMETTEISRMSGHFEGQTTDQMVARSRHLLQSFNELSLATGRNRDEIRQGTLAIMNQNRIFAMQGMMTRQASERFQELSAGLTAAFGQEQAASIANVIEQITSAGGSLGLVEGPLGEAAKYFQPFGAALQQISADIESGAITQEEGSRRIRDALASISPEDIRRMRNAGGEFEQAAMAVAGLQRSAMQANAAEQRRAAMSQEEREREARDRRSQEDTQAAYNQARAALNGMSTTFYRFVEQNMQGTIIPLMERFGEVLRAINSYLTPERMRMIGEGIQSVINVLSGMTPLQLAAVAVGVLALPSVIAAVAGAAAAAAIAAGFRGLTGRDLPGRGGGGRGPAGAGPGGAAGPRAPGIGGTLGRVAVGGAVAVAGGAIVNEAAGMLGVGGRTIDEQADAQNWERMTGIERVESGIARGIEAIGTFFGFGNFANEAAAARIRDETAYMQRQGRIPAAQAQATVQQETRVAGAPAGPQPPTPPVPPATPVAQTPPIAPITPEAVRQAIEIPPERLREATSVLESMARAINGISPAVVGQLTSSLVALFSVESTRFVSSMGGASAALSDTERQMSVYVQNIRTIVDLLNRENMQRIQDLGTAFDRMASTFRQGINTRQVQPVVDAVVGMLRSIQGATNQQQAESAINLLTQMNLVMSAVNPASAENIRLAGAALASVTVAMSGTISSADNLRAVLSNPMTINLEGMISGFNAATSAIDLLIARLRELRSLSLPMTNPASPARPARFVGAAGDADQPIVPARFERAAAPIRPIPSDPMFSREGRTAEPAAAATIPESVLAQRTIGYYDESMQRFSRMIEVLDRATDLLERVAMETERTARETESSTSRIVGAIESTSGTI